jgi:hypothetical protein
VTRRSAWLSVLCLTLFSTAAISRDEVEAHVAGACQPADKKLLASTFVNAVTIWLKRHEQKTITQAPDYVRMQVPYDYVYDLELTVTNTKAGGRVRADGVSPLSSGSSCVSR